MPPPFTSTTLTEKTLFQRVLLSGCAVMFLWCATLSVIVAGKTSPGSVETLILQQSPWVTERNRVNTEIVRLQEDLRDFKAATERALTDAAAARESLRASRDTLNAIESRLTEIENLLKKGQ